MRSLGRSDAGSQLAHFNYLGRWLGLAWPYCQLLAMTARGKVVPYYKSGVLNVTLLKQSLPCFPSQRHALSGLGSGSAVSQTRTSSFYTIGLLGAHRLELEQQHQEGSVPYRPETLGGLRPLHLTYSILCAEAFVCVAKINEKGPFLACSLSVSLGEEWQLQRL